jgi:hypothetical protein
MKDFTVYEYQERLARITELLRETDGWSDAYESTTGQTLIQLMVHVTDELHYMLQRRTTESYLETAILRSSIISRACELGYRFERAKANFGWLELVIDRPASADILIPQFTEILYDEIVYVTVSDVVINVGDTSVALYVKQAIVDALYGNVDTNGIITITDYENIDNGVLYVSENGAEYVDVTTNSDVRKRALIYSQPTDYVYDIKYTTAGMCIVFGDDVYGKRPSSEVMVQFIRVDFTNDPLNKIGNNFVFSTNDEIITDINGDEYEYTLQNTTKIVGSEPAESDFSIKRNATEYHKSNVRAVTNTDYAYWARHVDGIDIVDASVVGELELNTLIYNMNNVYLTYLKSDGTELDSAELEKLSNFMDTVKTTQAHIVYRNAKKLYIQALLEVRRNPKLSISDSELYDIIRNFLVDYFKPALGSIGKDYQTSDFIRDLYKQTITRNNIVYDLIDYCKFDMNGVIKLDYPPKTETSFVSFKGYVPQDGDRFVLILSNIVCEVPVYTGDAYLDIFNRMQDKIAEVTPFISEVVTDGVAFDAFGNATFVSIDNDVGETLLIGVDTPYFSKDELIGTASVGSTIVNAKLLSPALNVKHYYYSGREGRRPMIPLRTGGTVVNFTAPSDTVVNVYTRVQKDMVNSEVLLKTLQPNESFSESFDLDHVLIFEYENDSLDDRIADIWYPHFDITAFGIIIKSVGWTGGYTLIHTSGDIGDKTRVAYQIKLPVEHNKSVGRSYADKIERGSLFIYRKNDSGDVLICSDDSSGGLLDEFGVVIKNAGIDYTTGVLDLPINMSVGEYYIVYDQDGFDNFVVDSFTFAELIQPKLSFTDQKEELSRIGLR